MIKILLSFVLLFSFVLFSVQSSAAKTKSDVFGISLGMSHEAANKLLKKIGKLEKNESKLQEVWALNNDVSYSHLIVGFDKETNEVRFVTAKARENGKRVRYETVLDVKRQNKPARPTIINIFKKSRRAAKKPLINLLQWGKTLIT